MTLEQLRIFVAVAEHLHFTRASRALGLTQSAVSAAVAALEARTGVRLFHRVGRRIELTREGAAFLDEARRVLRAARHAEEALDEMSGLTRGTLALMGSQTIATYWLPRRLHRFRRRYPGIVVTLAIGNTAQVAEAAVAGEVDLAFVEGGVDRPELTVEAVGQDRMAAVVGAEQGWAVGRPVDATLLASLPWVLREEGSGTRAAALALLESFGLALRDCRVAFELPSNEAVRVAVEAGAGASVLSTLVVDAGLKLGTIRALDCALAVRRFSLLRHKERRLSRAAAAFVALLAEDPPDR